MSVECFGWASSALLALAFFFLCWAAVFRRPRERRFCPGPRPRWFARLYPPRWFFRRFCGYDLRGAPPLAENTVRCPECGRVCSAKQYVCGGRRWRPTAFAVLALLLAAFTIGGAARFAGGWPQIVPTPVLIVIEDQLNHRNYGRLRPLRDELETRVYSRKLSSALAQWYASNLVRDLRDDDVKWNADRAAALLYQLWPDSQPALEAALADVDAQAQMYAAGVLRDRSVFDPSDALLRRCVVDLGELPRPYSPWTAYATTGAAQFLAKYPGRIGPFLAKGLQSDDPQRRLICAALVAHTRQTDLLEAAAPLLVAQLAHDDLSGNAMLAAPALYRFGDAVTPWLEPLRHGADAQARQFAAAILARVAEAPSDEGPPLAPWVTCRTDDPLTELDLTDGIRNLR